MWIATAISQSLAAGLALHGEAKLVVEKEGEIAIEFFGQRLLEHQVLEGAGKEFDLKT